MPEVGRPTVMTQEVLDKLEYAFSIGCTDEEACIYADISPATLYNYQKDNPKFLERKELLKQTPILRARETVVKSLNSPDMAFRYLERKKKDEFAVRVENTGKDGKDLPIPILANLNVPSNDGHQENIETHESDQGSTGRDISQQDHLDTPPTDTPLTD